MNACFAVLIAPCPALVAAAPDRVPFPMDWSGHAQTAADLSCHLDAPAGRDGFIRAANGHLVKPDGARFRIWGVNICGPACFPEKSDAVALADQLARMGVNCVRFHDMDSGWSVLFDKSRTDTASSVPTPSTGSITSSPSSRIAAFT